MTDTAYFDGACEPTNPGGTGGWGCWIHTEDGEVLHEDCGILPEAPDMSNNVAEYTAAIRAVEAYVLNLKRPGPLLVLGDSKMVVMQMAGRWRIRRGFYKPLALKLQRFLREHAAAVDIEWRWIPRERNGVADGLSKRKLKEAGVRIVY